MAKQGAAPRFGPVGCPCCAASGTGLRKLLAGGFGRQRAEADDLGKRFVWNTQGADNVKDIDEFGQPQIGDPFTSAHLKLVDKYFPGWADVTKLLEIGSIKMVTEGKSAEQWLQKYASQKRNYEVPAPLTAPAPVAPAPPGHEGALVQTVLGPIGSRSLGMTLPHEHIFVSSAGLSTFPQLLPYEDYIIPNAVAKLQELKAAGGGSIVDCTTVDLGRDVEPMRRVSSLSGINIIATTGSWVDPSRSLYEVDPDTLARCYVHECTVGIQNTDVKAGIIKCAHEAGATWVSGTGFSRMGELTCRAAARAHKATGLNITTHTQVEEYNGMAQICIFEEEGVDLHRVYIGHCNDSTDIDYLTGMLKKGVWLGLDRTGPGMAEPGVTRPEWEERTTTIKKLIDAGWAHKIMLSHDWMVYLGFAGPVQGSEAHRDQNLAGYTFILKNVIPRLHQLGVSKEQTDSILYENPMRFFEGQG